MLTDLSGKNFMRTKEEKMNSLHIDIARELIACAQNKTTIYYSDLCDKVGYPSPRTIGRELEKISLLTEEKYGFFISALVVGKETPDGGGHLPGNGFFTMYRQVRRDSDIPITDMGWREAVALLERKKAYIADLSMLPEYIRNEIAAVE